MTVNTFSHESGSLSLRQVFAILVARRRFVFLVAALIFVLTALITLLLPRMWTASTSIYIDYNESDPINGHQLSAMLDDSYMQTQLELLQSQRVAGVVIDRLQLRNTPEYRQDVASDGQARADQALFQGLLRNLKIQNARGSRVVNVEYSDRSRTRARDIANTFASAYRELGEQMAVSAARSRFEQYNVQLDQLRKEVDTVQGQLTDYQQKNDILNVQEHGDQETQKLKELNSTLTALQTSLQEAKANQAATRELLKAGMKPYETPIANQSPVITALKTQLGDIDRRLGDVKGSLGRNHPLIRGLSSERQRIFTRLTQESQSLLAGTDGTIARLTTQIADLQQDIEQQRQKVLTQMQQRNQMDAYQRRLASAQQVYNAALQKYDTLIMASNIMSPNVTVLRSAELPSTPSKPRVLLNLLLGLVVGVACAVMLTLLLELSDRRVNTVEDLLGDPDLPLLGQIGLKESRA